MGHSTSSGRSRANETAAPEITPINANGTIQNDRVYRVQKITPDEISDYGDMNGSDVKLVVRGTTYDPVLGMWFSRSGRVGYAVTEAR